MQKKLRQGFGRAIRTEQDTCVVSILDHRATKKGRYRSDVLEALPKCQMAERIEEVENFIRSRKVERYYSWEHPWRYWFCPDPGSRQDKKFSGISGAVWSELVVLVIALSAWVGYTVY